MIDCHAHLADDVFLTDIGDVIKTAQDGGVQACILVPENSSEFERTLELSELFKDFIAPCFGVHPVQGQPGHQRSVTLDDLESALPLMEKHVDRIIGVGEIGLDFTPRFITGNDTKDIQREVLKKQIEFAMKFDLPINVHSRSAGRPTIQLLKDMGVKNAVLHAFDGKVSVAMEGVRQGYYFSIPPCIVRSEQKQKIVDGIPLENLLLETDSPALGPEKQERNVPANLSISCEFIAKIKGKDVDFVKKVTTDNALKLLPKLKRFVRVR